MVSFFPDSKKFCHRLFFAIKIFRINIKNRKKLKCCIEYYKSVNNLTKVFIEYIVRRLLCIKRKQLL